MKSLISFIKGSWEELGKIVWPKGDQIVKQTQRVLISVFIIACFFGLVDYMLFLAIENLF